MKLNYYPDTDSLYIDLSEHPGVESLEVSEGIALDYDIEVPVFETIGLIGLLALAANSLCLVLLWRHRTDDINMSSVWLCSRNDIIANASVLCAAVGVWLTSSGWPDILVGLALAALFLRSAVFVLRDAKKELRVTAV